ncbi:MAG: hypothetical protein NC412_03820 [Roseburia sp.]|nr:hypothetical protein [Roseburia sp.]MCM1278274.1 hypothetical protein [Robinsoniella sp.]
MTQNNKQKEKFHIEQGMQIFVEACLFLFLAFVFVKGFGQVDTTGSYGILALAGSLCMLLFFFYGMGRLFRALPKSLLKKLFPLQCALILFVQMFFLFYYRSLYLWDGAFVAGGANSLLEQGRVAGEAWYYLSVYPNQNGFVLLTMGLLKLGKCFGMTDGSLPLLFNGVNLAALDISLFFTFLLWKKIKPESDCYWRNMLLLFWGCNPFLYVTVSYYYTMTLSLPWFMGFLYFFVSMVKGKEDKWNKQAVRALGTGICFGIGYYLRATTIIPFIGAAVCGALLLWKSRNQLSKKILRSCLCHGLVAFFAAICLTAFLTAVGVKVIGIDTRDTAFPTTHWLMMSLSGEGFHNEEDEAFTAGFSTKEEKKQAVRERLAERLKELGIAGCIRQAGKKIDHTFSGGANSYKMFYENAIRTDKGYSYILGEKSGGFLCYAQAYHMLVLLFIVLGFQKRFRWESFLLQITLLGGFLFYVLWEAAAQYQIPFLLIMGLLAGMGMEKESKAAYSRKGRAALLVMGAMGAVLLGSFLLINYRIYTKEEREMSHPAVTQLLANEPFQVRESLTQSFSCLVPFNYLLFQWRNPLGEENDSAYRVTLTGTSSGLIFTETLKEVGKAYQGGFEKQFETVYPRDGETFLLTMEKTEGSRESYMEFVTYYMGGYDSYPKGGCLLEEGRDLTFLVSEKTIGSLYSVKEYVIFVTGLFLLFLFLVFCCKIEKNGKGKDFSYGN